jgi:SEC-C motif domain protein
MKNDCYCGSNIPFDECCKPIIEGTKQAETAQDLMRSRYSAYVINDAQYLMDSTHFSTKANFSKSQIESWAKESSWQKLEIINTQKGLENDNLGKVEFKAYYKDKKGTSHVHHEKSSFKKEEGRWYFVDGYVIHTPPPPSVTTDRNAPCVCGSGKKFKKCCGG